MTCVDDLRHEELPTALRTAAFGGGLASLPSNPYGTLTDGTRRIWKVKRYEARHLSGGELRKISEGLGGRYGTAKTGRPGWNIRQTFPRDSGRRGLPVLVGVRVEGETQLFLLVPTQNFRPVQ